MSFIMTRVKLLVFLVYMNVVFTLCHNYCKICRNHTLCKFPVAGPSPSCAKYDGTKLLTQDDIESIVNKINDRRNFIALSRSKYLPGAANMRKVVWSHELADFAQRWVDQCDPSTRPDKEDDCRNLGANEVGQNIATLSELSPGFNVKNFIEMWYMQSIDYSGSVTFYNKADNRTKYFTQLIWAETHIVGCGQASFHVQNLRLTLRRLVCNFSPRGNILGKPIYIIGYPATQCPDHMVPDENYKGLCTYRKDVVSEKQMTQTSPVSSLLRIINLSDSPELLNNQTSKNNESSQIASMFINKTHAAVKRYPHNFMSKTINHSKPHENYLHEDENHQRLNDLMGSYIANNLHTINKNTDHMFKKHETGTTSIVSNSRPNYGGNKSPLSCTRKTKILREHCDDTDRDSVKCTRGQAESRTKLSNQESIRPTFICPCDSSTTTSTTTENWMSNINCPCLDKSNLQKLCSNFRRQEEENFHGDKHTSSTFYYYDLLPNLHVRQQMRRENLKNKFFTYPFSKEDDSFDGSNRKKRFDQHYRNRKKRDDTQYTTAKPFWKMDDSVLKRTLQPKAARYTTITNRKIKQTKRTTLVKSTESITVKVTLPTTFLNKQSIITEKYLSFDELMQLRKLNIGGDLESRRKGADSPTKGSSTTIEITANTPFVRMKHCTRKLTCTWTVPKFTDCNGSVIPDNDGSNRGSRTPPGYVDGCTRTSTCTRDYMDRNKMASTTDEVLELSATTPIEADDDDYCERRSLKIKRRNSDEEIKSSNVYGFITLDLTTNFPTNTIKECSTTQIRLKPKINNDCECYDLANQERGKRNYIITSKEYVRHHKKHDKKRRIYYEEMHYGELYYKILGKLKQTWEKSKRRNRLGNCFCNKSSSCHHNSILLLLFLCIRFTR